MALVKVVMPPMAVPISTPHRCASSCLASSSGSRLMPAASKACHSIRLAQVRNQSFMAHVCTRTGAGHAAAWQLPIG